MRNQDPKYSPSRKKPGQGPASAFVKSLLATGPRARRGRLYASPRLYIHRKQASQVAIARPRRTPWGGRPVLALAMRRVLLNAEAYELRPKVAKGAYPPARGKACRLTVPHAAERPSLTSPMVSSALVIAHPRNPGAGRPSSCSGPLMILLPLQIIPAASFPRQFAECEPPGRAISP